MRIRTTGSGADGAESPEVEIPGFEAAFDADVVVVGAGPVGLVTALLLARHGHEVVVVEQYAEPYPKPRAVHFDGEVARLLAVCGVGDALASMSVSATEYDWRSADGSTLLHFDWSAMGPSGWPNATMFHQPDLERALARRLNAFPGVRVLRGRKVLSVAQDDDSASVTLAESTLAETFPEYPEPVLRARFVVGCDGADSTVAAALPAAVTDLGFSFDWLIVDVVHNRSWSPLNLQVCDPARPVSAISGGPGRRRFEFMRLPDETPEELCAPDTVRSLLTGWDLADAEIDRQAMYTFRARWLDSWGQGRVFVAGDAAHLMPPFAGQGMCAGVRDAANLTWKLDLALRRPDGPGVQALLDSYTSERLPHLRRAVEMSVTLGQIMCVTDPEEAAERNQNLLAAGGDGNALEAALPPALLGPGLLTGNEPAPVGRLAVQGRVARDGVIGMLDEVVGTEFVVLHDGYPPPLPAGVSVRSLAGAGIRLVTLLEPGPQPPGTLPSGMPHGAVIDVDGVHLKFLREHEICAAVVRPDFYVQAAATAPEHLPKMLADLLTLVRP